MQDFKVHGQDEGRGLRACGLHGWDPRFAKRRLTAFGLAASVSDFEPCLVARGFLSVQG